MIAPNVDVNVTHSLTLSGDTSDPRTQFVARTLTLSQSNRLAARALQLEEHVRRAGEHRKSAAVLQAQYDASLKDEGVCGVPEVVGRLYQAEQDAAREGTAALTLACEMFELLFVDVHNAPTPPAKVACEFGTGVSREWAMEGLARNYGPESVVEMVMAARRANRLSDLQRKNLLAQSGSANMPPGSTAPNASPRGGGSAAVAIATAPSSTGGQAA